MERSIDGLMSDSSTEEIVQNNIPLRELSDAEVDNRVIVVGGGLGGLATACTTTSMHYSLRWARCSPNRQRVGMA